jgi:hypothetical protein
VLAADELPQQAHIRVTAEGRVQAYPDQVRLQVSVSQTSATLAAAKQVVDDLTGQIISAALAHGAQKEEVESSQIFASPHQEWQNNQQVYIGERVQRSITVITRDLPQYSALMQAIIMVPKPAKNREVRVDQVALEFKDPTAVEQQALQQALLNAQTKAELMAKTLNAKLGKVYLISDASAPAAPVYARSMAMMESADKQANSELQIGKQEVVQSVQVVFFLAP